MGVAVHTCISALTRLRQEGCCGFEASLGYTLRIQGQSELHREALSQKTNKTKTTKTKSMNLSHETSLTRIFSNWKLNSLVPPKHICPRALTLMTTKLSPPSPGGIKGPTGEVPTPGAHSPPLPLLPSTSLGPETQPRITDLRKTWPGSRP